MTDYLLAIDSYQAALDNALNLLLDVSNLNGIGVNLWTVGSLEVSTVAAVTYKMRGMDAAINGTYDTWLASGSPDFSGAYYAGALARPLRDIVLIDSWTAPPSSIASGNPYIDPPTVANSFDDEFNTGSADLAVRGWTVVNASGVTMTRAGDIQPWNATGPVGNTYWSTIVGSWLFIQAAPGVQIDMYKTIVLASGDTYFARTGGTHNFATAASGRYNEVGLYGASGAAVDNNNRVYNTVRDDTTAACLMYDVGRTTAAAFAGSTGRNALGGHDVRGIHFDSGTTHHGFIVDSAAGVKSMTITGCPASGTLTRFGMRNLFSASGSATAQVWGIDYARKKIANAWIAS